jgi:hypothetical protein
MRWVLSSTVVLLLGSTSVVAQNDPVTSSWVPTLVVRPVPSYPDGARVSDVTGYLRLTKGEPALATIWSQRSLCSFAFSNVDPATQAFPPEFGFNSAATVWRMTGKYLGEQNGRYQVRVTSGFTRLDGSESTSTITQTLSLRDGDSVVLDALKKPADAACPVHVVTFEARLTLQPTDPALALARYTADMWLVHTDPGGQEHREHLVTNVDGSTVVPFMFNRLAFPIPQVDPRQGDAEAVIQLTGALRVRPRGDGTVFLDLETNRFLFGLQNPDAPLRSSPTTMRMTFTTRDGETVAVDFPPPSSGFSSITLNKDGRKDGTTTVRARPGKTTQTLPSGAILVKEGKLVLYTFEFFRGHKTQLLITLRKLP